MASGKERRPERGKSSGKAPQIAQEQGTQAAEQGQEQSLDAQQQQQQQQQSGSGETPELENASQEVYGEGLADSGASEGYLAAFAMPGVDALWEAASGALGLGSGEGQAQAPPPGSAPQGDPLVKEWSGGVTFEQYPDGTLVATDGDAQGQQFAAGTPENTAITSDIGAYEPAAIAAELEADPAAEVADGGLAQGLGGLLWEVLPDSAQSIIGESADPQAMILSARQALGLAPSDEQQAARAAAVNAMLTAQQAQIQAMAQAEAAAAALRPLDPANVQSRSAFVSEKVVENSLTTAILDKIWKYYPSGTQCIGGYLGDAAQQWKINYHYEAWLWSEREMAAVTGEPALSDDQKATLAGHRTTLEGLAPSGTGYLNDGNVGDTEDTSTPDQVRARHSALAAAKRDLNAIYNSTETAKHTASEDRVNLASQVVAGAGKSKHGTGFAVDIRKKGSNGAIAAISRQLGGTCLDEDFHVHVEFGGGVTTEALDAQYAVKAQS